VQPGEKSNAGPFRRVRGTWSGVFVFVGEGVVPGQVLPIPGVSVPAVCAVRWDEPCAR